MNIKKQPISRVCRFYVASVMKIGQREVGKLAYRHWTDGQTE